MIRGAEEEEDRRMLALPDNIILIEENNRPVDEERPRPLIKSRCFLFNINVSFLNAAGENIRERDFDSVRNGKNFSSM